MCQECFPAISVLPSRIAAAIKRRAVFNSENVSGQWSKSTTMTCENRFCHTRFLKEWNADDVRITRGNTSSYPNRRFCVEKLLTKSRVCGIIFLASERDSYRSNKIHRGIAQLVEQRSPKPRAEGSSPSAPAIRKTPENGLNKPFSGVFVFSFFHGARSENALLML